MQPKTNAHSAIKSHATLFQERQPDFKEAGFFSLRGSIHAENLRRTRSIHFLGLKVKRIGDKGERRTEKKGRRAKKRKKRAAAKGNRERKKRKTNENRPTKLLSTKPITNGFRIKVVYVLILHPFKYESYQRRILVEDLNKKWKQVLLQTSPETPLEHCEWLNKLLIEVWPNYISPKIAIRFSSIVEKRLKDRKLKLIERIELQAIQLGSCPPILGLHGTRWTTPGDQRIVRLGFDGTLRT